MPKKRIIICGGGNSIPFDDEKGLDSRLSDFLRNEYTIGLNLWYKYASQTTINTWADWQFYRQNLGELKHLPLCVGKYDPSLFRLDLIQENTITIPFCSNYWGLDSWSPDFQEGKNKWEKGFYNPNLVGMFALTLAIALGFEEIYLLGYDCCEVKGKTHFYQNIVDLSEKRDGEKTLVHYGVGKTRVTNNRTGITKEVYNTGTYNNSDKQFNERWIPFEQELSRIKIFNVSPESRIDVFKKLTYDEFYAILKEDKRFINQDDARQEISDLISLKRQNAKNNP